MKQKIIIPQISKCYCGTNAKIQTWDNYGEYIYQVVCENRHTLTKYCGTKNRAIHRWNNRILKFLNLNKTNMKEELKKRNFIYSQ